MKTLSFLAVIPEEILSSVSSLTGIGSSLDESLSSKIPALTDIPAMAEDEVSAAISALFNSHAAVFEGIATQATNFHARFANILGSGASLYSDAESSVVSTLSTPSASFLGVHWFSPVLDLTGRPLFGNGVSAAA
ncbi:PE family protein, partial [Mycobacterium sp. THU-M116]